MATIASTRRRRSRRLSAQSAATAAPADEAAPVPTTRTKRKALGAIPNNNNEDAAAPKKIGKKTAKSSSSSSDKTGAAVAKAQPKTKTKPAKAKSKSTQKTKKTAASKSVAEGVTSTAENKSGAQAKSEDAGQPANPVATAASLAQIRLTHELHYVNELDRGKPLACFEYAQEIHRNNLIHESQSPRNCSYLATVQNLTLTPKVRGILIDWLVEVALEFEFQDETLYLSVALVDQALSKFRVKKAKLQLLGCACMLLASKYEEVVTRSVEDFVYVSDRAYSNSEICDMELKICTALGFSLTFPTQLSFLTRFLHVDVTLSARQKMCAKYLSELALVEYQMLQYKASVVAASCVCMAKLIVPRGKRMLDDPWSAILEYESGYSLPQLQDCITALNMMMLTDMGSAVSPTLALGTDLVAVREKYTHQEALFIATRVAPLPNFDAKLQAHVQKRCSSSESGAVAAKV